MPLNEKDKIQLTRAGFIPMEGQTLDAREYPVTADVSELAHADYETVIGRRIAQAVGRLSEDAEVRFLECFSAGVLHRPAPGADIEKVFERAKASQKDELEMHRHTVQIPGVVHTVAVEPSVPEMARVSLGQSCPVDGCGGGMMWNTKGDGLRCSSCGDVFPEVGA